MHSAVLDVHFCATPYTFVLVDGYTQIWDAPERTRIGVYLWCIPVRDALLVNYVGKTSDRGGFESRLWCELKDWRKGRYCVPVDIEKLKRGQRVVLASRPVGHLEAELRELEPLYRLLLAPLSSDEECRHVKGTILKSLWSHRSTAQFLCNREKGRRPLPSPTLRYVSDSPIVGLTIPVPEWLQSLGELANAENVATM